MMRTILAILFIIAAIASFVVFTMPRWRGVQTLQEQQRQYDVALDNALELQRVSQVLSEKYNNIAATDIMRLESFLPDNIDNVKLILELDVLAQGQGVDLQNVQVIEEAVANQRDQLALENRRYRDMSLEFTVTGNYANFASFIDRLDTSLRLIDIDSISFVARDTDSVYTYTVQITSYYLANNRS